MLQLVVLPCLLASQVEQAFLKYSYLVWPWDVMDKEWDGVFWKLFVCNILFTSLNLGSFLVLCVCVRGESIVKVLPDLCFFHQGISERISMAFVWGATFALCAMVAVGAAAGFSCQWQLVPLLPKGSTRTCVPWLFWGVSWALEAVSIMWFSFCNCVMGCLF